LYEGFNKKKEVMNKEVYVYGDNEKMFRTMLVEDNPSFRQLVKINLQDQFSLMNIIEAADGVEALQEIDGHPPNLIFMDISLPSGNGLELTKRIKADYPDVIIIILTSHDSLEYREAAIRCKADYFFSKGELTNDGIFTLVKSILLAKGFNADGSGGERSYP
jgi:DNA-binding NarL/FixJ family response regulator